MPSIASAMVRPTRRMRAVVRVPGDKSISHRYAILAALADGPSHLHNYAPGDDGRSTLACLRALGVAIARGGPHGETVRVDGRGVRGLAAPGQPLDAGNSGTTMRLLAGVLAAHPFHSTLVGDASLSRRPMRRVIDPLTRMGARIESHDGRAPLRIAGGSLHGMTYEPEAPSAQVKSAILLAGLQATGTTAVLEDVPTRDHTELALRAFGAIVTTGGKRIELEGGQRLRGAELTVPGDISSAAFWAVAAAGIPGATATLQGVGLNPSRAAFLALLRRAGAEVEIEPDAAALHGSEPAGTVHVRHRALGPLAIAPDEVASVIDEIPALAALAAFGADVSVRGAGELRVKESDRIAALVAGMRALGAEAVEHADGFEIRGADPWTWAGGEPDAAGDHRLAMAFAVAGLGAAAPSIVRGAEAVAISYPGFFDVLSSFEAPRV